MSTPALGYVILYVPSVRKAIDFYTRAFGFEDTFEHPGGDYGEVRNGETRLAFTAHTLAAEAVPFSYTPCTPEHRPGIEITLTTPDVDGAWARAVQAGAEPLSEPHDEPWGQRVGYVADPHGLGIGIATPMG